MKRHWIAMATSACALALTPSVALAGGQHGSLGNLLEQSQTATNENTTEQSASSEASSRQTNVNMPISILSQGSNDGAVNQSNDAHTSSSAGNENNTEQGNSQSQRGTVQGGGGGAGDNGSTCGCGEGSKRDQGDGGQQVSQSQSASNDNSQPGSHLERDQ